MGCVAGYPLGVEEQSMDSNLGNGQLAQVEAESLYPSWLLKTRPRAGLSEGARQRLNRLQLKPRSPDFGSAAPLSEVPRTKYQKTLVLICYPVSLSGDQKVFVTWVLCGGAGTGDMGWVFVEHLTECESGRGVQNTPPGLTK